MKEAHERIRITCAADLGKLVRERRRELSMTQAEFAALSGVGRRFLVELEQGKPTLQVDRVLKVFRDCGYELFGERR